VILLAKFAENETFRLFLITEMQFCIFTAQSSAEPGYEIACHLSI